MNRVLIALFTELSNPTELLVDANRLISRTSEMTLKTLKMDRILQSDGRCKQQ